MSTFSVEMREMAFILRHVRSNAPTQEFADIPQKRQWQQLGYH